MGFTRHALLRLRATFARFDGDGDGRLMDPELKASLRWLGLEAFADEDAAASAGDKAATTSQCTISETSFFAVVSRCHEREVAAVNTAFSNRDVRMRGSVDLRDLPAIFEDLGYKAVTPQICREACAACNSQDARSSRDSAPSGQPSSGHQPPLGHHRRRGSGWGRSRMVMPVGSEQSDADNQLHLVQVMERPCGLSSTSSSSSLQWRKLPKDLLFEDFYSVVEEVRDTHCLSCSERTEALEAFDLHASSKAEGITPVEMVRAALWMGFPVHLGRVLEIFDELDLHDTYRRRDVQEFLRLVQRLRENEVVCARARLKKGLLRCTCNDAEQQDKGRCERCLAEFHGCGLLPAAAFGVLLGDLGHAASWEDVSRLEEAAGGRGACMPLWDVLQLLTLHRQSERGSLRNNFGFTEQEVKRMQQRSSRFGSDGKGGLKRRDVPTVVEALVSKKRRSTRLWEITREVLQRTDPSFSEVTGLSEGTRARRGTLTQSAEVDFQELLQMMRMIFDQDDEERLEKEKDIVNHPHFSREEVHEFRRLFHGASQDGEKRLLLGELERLVARVMTVTSSMKQDLREVVARAAGISGEEALDFGDFLTVMRHLLDQNWANINEAASESALAANKLRRAARTEVRTAVRTA